MAYSSIGRAIVGRGIRRRVKGRENGSSASGSKDFFGGSEPKIDFRE